MSKLTHRKPTAADSGGSSVPDLYLDLDGDETDEVSPEHPFGARILGAGVAGLVAGGAMYLTLAAFAVAQGRGFAYPLQAAQGLMSGRRVIPDHPANAFATDQLSDYVVGPLSFFAPAVFVAVAATLWASRRRKDGRSRELTRGAVLAPVALLTGAMFLVFVLGIGFQESDLTQQRISSGYGIRQLGLWAWVSAHIVYVLVLTAALASTVRLVAAARSRRGSQTPL